MNLRMLLIIGATWCATTASFGADKTALAKDAVADIPVTTTSVTIPVAEPTTSPKPSGYSKRADIVRPGETKPSEQQIKDWNAPIKGFHPIKRMMRPLWKLRQEARSLEGNIMELQKPMSGLQPAFASMESRMGGVQDELKSMGIPTWTWTPSGPWHDRTVPALPPHENLDSALAKIQLQSILIHADVKYQYGTNADSLKSS